MTEGHQSTKMNQSRWWRARVWHRKWQFKIDLVNIRLRPKGKWRWSN